MRYLEHSPPPSLAPWVRCLWTLQGVPGAADGGEPILPDGCVEFVLNFGDRFRRYHDDGRVERQPRALIAGQITRSIAIEPEGTIDLVGIRFHPWGAAPFLRVSATTMRDRMFELAETGPLAQTLECIGETSDTGSRAELAWKALSEFAPRARTPRPAAAVVTRLVNDGADSVRMIASRLGLTTRAVQDAFQHEVGMSPKTLMRISRLQRAANLARCAPGLTLSRIAIGAGYHDHAHLAHDCRDIAGVTPTALFGATAELTDVFLDRGAA